MHIASRLPRELYKNAKSSMAKVVQVLTEYCSGVYFHSGQPNGASAKDAAEGDEQTDAAEGPDRSVSFSDNLL